MTSPVLTAIEAARWLRLDDDHDDPGQAVKALRRLVWLGKLRPLKCGQSHKYTLAALERFIRDEVELGTLNPSPIRPDSNNNCDPTGFVPSRVPSPDRFPP